MGIADSNCAVWNKVYGRISHSHRQDGLGPTIGYTLKSSRWDGSSHPTVPTLKNHSFYRYVKAFSVWTWAEHSADSDNGHLLIDTHRNWWQGSPPWSIGLNHLQADSLGTENRCCQMWGNQHLWQLLQEQGAFTLVQTFGLPLIVLTASLPQLPAQAPHREP